MITISDQAAAALRAMLDQKNAGPDEGLRLGVERGGCAGQQYAMKISRAEDGDITVKHGTVSVFIAQDSTAILQGCHIDYSDSLADAGFKISNPNAARSCGCGTSFEPTQKDGEEQVEGQPCN